MRLLRYINFKLSGSSMVEVLIALSITSICACLAVIIYLNIQQSSLPFFRLKAVELAEKYMKTAIETRDMSDESHVEDGFTVRKKIEVSQILPDCAVIRVIVFDGAKQKMYELESIVAK